jgi:AbrB family looped-hinge helix DNA binding protein
MPRLTSKGQVTVPVSVRWALGLAPGDEVVFAVEHGRGVFRKAVALGDLSARFPGDPHGEAHPLERLLRAGDRRFADELAEAVAARRRVRVPDAVVLDIGATLVRTGAPPAEVAGALGDVLAQRGIRVDHPAAVRSAIGELAAGGDPFRAYALARG